MTYDERQEIGNYLDIIKKNCERTLRSVDLMRDVLGKIECKIKNDNQGEESAKENFLKRF